MEFKGEIKPVKNNGSMRNKGYPIFRMQLHVDKNLQNKPDFNGTLKKRSVLPHIKFS